MSVSHGTLGPSDGDLAVLNGDLGMSDLGVLGDALGMSTFSELHSHDPSTTGRLASGSPASSIASGHGEWCTNECRA